MRRCNIASNVRKSTIIGDLPTDILHTILELMPIEYAARTSILSKQWRKLWSTQPHLVFDCHFFQYVSNKDASAASIIHKILMQHTGPILGFHLISKRDALSQSDVDQCIIFVSNHGIQKLTLDMANDLKYELPYSIFTCPSLTHLKLTRCVFELLEDGQFPNLVSLKLENSDFEENYLILPMLETLELSLCVDGQFHNLVNMVCPKLVNLSITRSYAVTFECFNVNPIFERIKYLCLDRSSLMSLGSFPVQDRLHVSLKLQSLKINDLMISVQHISSALCLMRSSPELCDLDIDEVVRVDDTLFRKTKLLSYLSEAENHVNEALTTIRTVRLRKFKGSCAEMYLIKVLLAHSSKLEKMIIEQSLHCNANERVKHLEELISYSRVSPRAVFKYI